jgi:hypothetical protein
MRRHWTIALTVAAVVVVAIQLVPVDRGTSAAATLDAPPEVQAALAATCFDCHSGATDWPWYSRVAPVSWIVAHHVEEGREHLDFSSWNDVDAGRRAHWRQEMVEVIESGEMPPGYYTFAHADAVVDDHTRGLLLRWARDGSGGHRED